MSQQELDQAVHPPDLPLLALVRQRNRHLLSEILAQPGGADQERLLGCMLGLAVGDVLGCPVEGLSFREIQSRYGTVDGLLFATPGRRWRLPGLHSDDTQQALAVLEAVRRSRRGSASRTGLAYAAAVARELASIYVEGLETAPQAPLGCWRGTGQGFRRVVERLRQNRQAGKWPYGYGEPSAGLGAVMRIPPAGLLGGDSADIAELVAHITYLTHTDALATVSACTIAFSCQLLHRDTAQSFAPDRFLSALYQRVQGLEQQPPTVPYVQSPREKAGALLPLNSTLVSLLTELRDAPPGTAMREIARRTQSLIGRSLAPTGGFAPSGVAASLYFFLHNAHHPKKALLTAINAGGDTDTIGAIVGALAGTLHGVSAYREFLPDVVALDLIVGQTWAALHPEADNSYVLVDEEGLLTATEQHLRTQFQRHLEGVPAAERRLSE